MWLTMVMTLRILYLVTELLFVYQNALQHRLLNRYGNELVLLDAMYRTTRYALPLFFLVVRTNVDYQVVGAFICETETSESIEEALRIFWTWNPELQPKYCIQIIQMRR